MGSVQALAPQETSFAQANKQAVEVMLNFISVLSSEIVRFPEELTLDTSNIWLVLKAETEPMDDVTQAAAVMERLKRSPDQ